MPPLPLWVALLGLVGNSAVLGTFYTQANPWWPLFAVATIISFSAAHRAGSVTAVRTAESETP